MGRKNGSVAERKIENIAAIKKRARTFAEVLHFLIIKCYWIRELPPSPTKELFAKKAAELAKQIQKDTGCNVSEEDYPPDNTPISEKAIDILALLYSLRNQLL